MESIKPNKENQPKLNRLKDEDLLGLLEQDSTAAFEELYIRYKDKLKTFCIFILKSETVAQDMVQDIFIKIWLNRKTLNTGQSFSHYVYTLAKNQSLNELRSAKRKELMESILIIQQDEFSVATAETRLIFDEYQNLLEEAIAKLPEQKRCIYQMSREEGLSHKEIAAKMGLSPHTIQTHVSDSLRFIKEYFLQHADMELYAIFVVLWLK
jgi:RNA polymerase sigma-70 factor, ECF subfamily